MRKTCIKSLLIGQILFLLIFLFVYVLFLSCVVKIFLIRFGVPIIHEPIEVQQFVPYRKHKVESLLKSFCSHIDKLQHSIYVAIRPDFLMLNSDTSSMSPFKNSKFNFPQLIYKSSILWQWRHMLGIESIHLAGFYGI